MKSAPRAKRSLALAILVMALGAVFIGLPHAAHADIVQQRDFSTPVASNDSNVNFYIGSSTVALVISDMSVWLADSTGGLGTTVSLRLTCFANDTTTSQSGCADTSAHTSNSIAAYNTFGQEYFFTWTVPVTIQANKYYLLEIVGATASDKPVVYGATTLQWSNQCNFAGLGSQCTGTPYFTENAAPNWTGINASSTPLTALYNNTASDTLSHIATQCQASGNVFSEALCATFTFLLVPDPTIVNGYASLASTTLPSKFPFSWFYAVNGTFNSLTASSTANMAAVSVALSSADPATTTPFGHILPDMTVLSTSTITHFMPAGLLALLLFLEASALWVIFGMYLWRDIPKWLNT